MYLLFLNILVSFYFKIYHTLHKFICWTLHLNGFAFTGNHTVSKTYLKNKFPAAESSAPCVNTECFCGLMLYLVTSVGESDGHTLADLSALSYFMAPWWTGAVVFVDSCLSLSLGFWLLVWLESPSQMWGKTTYFFFCTKTVVNSGNSGICKNIKRFWRWISFLYFSPCLQ